MASGRVYRRYTNWYIDIYTGRIIDGKRERVRYASTHKYKAGAQEELAAELNRLNRAAKIGGAPDNNYPLAELLKLWLSHITNNTPNPQTCAEYSNQAKEGISALESIRIFSAEQLTPTAIDDMIAELLKRYSHNTINKIIAKLKALLNFGVERGLIARNNIATYKKLPEKRVKLRRALTEDEARKLLEIAPEPFNLIWRFILSTGLRKEELTNLQWQNIDLKAGIVKVHPVDEWTPKTDTGIRVIPLSENLIKALSDIQSKSGYVFPTPDGKRRKNNLLREFRAHIRNTLLSMREQPHGQRVSKKKNPDYQRIRAEVEDELQKLDLHALRYTFCTQLIAKGVDVKTVQKLMGHKSPEITLRIYAQYCHGNADSAIKALSWA